MLLFYFVYIFKGSKTGVISLVWEWYMSDMQIILRLKYKIISLCSFSSIYVLTLSYAWGFFQTFRTLIYKFRKNVLYNWHFFNKCNQTWSTEKYYITVMKIDLWSKNKCLLWKFFPNQLKFNSKIFIVCNFSALILIIPLIPCLITNKIEKQSLKLVYYSNYCHYSSRPN